MGFEPQQPCSTLESANEFVEHMALGLEEAKAALTGAEVVEVERLARLR
jgi:hypothetical protein